MMGGRQAEVMLQVTLVRAEHMGKRNETCECSYENILVVDNLKESLGHT